MKNREKRNNQENNIKKEKKGGKKLQNPSKNFSFDKDNLDNNGDIFSNIKKTSGLSLSGVKIVKNSSIPVKNKVPALTIGNEVHFSHGSFSPDTRLGKKIISHELFHVHQQRTSKTRNQRSRNDYLKLESEADHFANKTEKGERTNLSTAPLKVSSPAMQMWGYKNRGLKFWKKTDDEVAEEKNTQQEAPVVKSNEQKEGIGDKISPYKDIGLGAKKLSDSSDVGEKMKDFSKIDGFGEGKIGVGTKLSMLGAASDTLNAGKAGFGAWKDFRKGKFSKDKGGKGWQGAMRSAGRGTRNLAGLASDGLSITKDLAEASGNVGLTKAMGKAVPGMDIVTGSMDAVSGGLKAFKARKRRKMINQQIGKMEKEGGDQKQIDAFKHISEIQKKRRNSGLKKAGLGVGSAVAAGLMLNPATAGVGLALGGALMVGKGGHALFKKYRQHRRDKYANAAKYADKNVSADDIKNEHLNELSTKQDALGEKAAYKGINPLKKFGAWKAKKDLKKVTKEKSIIEDPSKAQDEIDQLKEKSEYKGHNPFKKFGAWRAGKKQKKLENLQNYGDVKKAEAVKLNKEYQGMKGKWYAPDIEKSTDKKNERYDNTVSAIMGMDNKTQNIALKSLGLNKFKKDKKGNLTEKHNEYYDNLLKDHGGKDTGEQESQGDTLKTPEQKPTMKKLSDRSIFNQVMGMKNGKGQPKQGTMKNLLWDKAMPETHDQKNQNEPDKKEESSMDKAERELFLEKLKKH